MTCWPPSDHWMHSSKRWEVSIRNCVCLAVTLVDTQTTCQLPTPAILLSKFTTDRCITGMTSLLCCIFWGGQMVKLISCPQQHVQCYTAHPSLAPQLYKDLYSYNKNKIWLSCAYQLAVPPIYILDCASHRKETSVLSGVLKGLSCLAHDSRCIK